MAKQYDKPPRKGHRPSGNAEKLPSAECIERERRMLEARRDGASYRKIAADEGINVKTAFTIVQRALKRTLMEPADELRHLESERLDRLLLLCMQKIEDGNLGAVDRAVKIIELRAKLFGLQLPPQGMSPELQAGLGLVGQLAQLFQLQEAPDEEPPAGGDGDQDDDAAEDEGEEPPDDGRA